MPFAAALRKSLQDRGNEAPAEFMRGDSLEDVLNRHLMTIERMGGELPLARATVGSRNSGFS